MCVEMKKLRELAEHRVRESHRGREGLVGFAGSFVSLEASSGEQLRGSS